MDVVPQTAISARNIDEDRNDWVPCNPAEVRSYTPQTLTCLLAVVPLLNCRFTFPAALCTVARKTVKRIELVGEPRLAMSIVTLFCVLTLGGLTQSTSNADEPLHRQIDKLVSKDRLGPTTELAGDADFLRRVYLDLTGSIPSSQQTREFLENASPNKRRALIDKLVRSPAFNRHFARVLDVMLMERRGHKHVKRQEWDQYLVKSLEENKKFDVLAAEILAADGAERRAPAKFYLEREVEPHLLTREVGRMFFGMDLECAQCHDHPLIDSYVQSDYYGIYAFLHRSYLFQPDKKKPAVLAEKPQGEVTFTSVFTGDDGQTGPRLPGAEQITEPQLEKDELYLVPPDKKNKKLRAIPKYSRRSALASLATDGSNRAFNHNIVNRLWAHMMGRGIVHPVDLHHENNPPTHPELLEVLADSFVEMEFDMKAFLGELAQSHTYQRSILLPDSLAESYPAIAQQVAAIESRREQLKKELADLKQEADEHLARLTELDQSSKETIAQCQKAEAEEIELAKLASEASRKATSAIAQLTGRKKSMALLNESLARLRQAVDASQQEAQLAELTDAVKSNIDVLSTQIAQLTADVATCQANQMSAHEQLQSGRQAAVAFRLQRDSVIQEQRACQRQWDLVRRDSDEKESELRGIQQQIAEGRLIVQWGERLALSDERHAALEQAKRESQIAERTLNDARGRFSEAEVNLEAARSKHHESSEAVIEVQQGQKAVGEAIRLLHGAASHVQLAMALLPDDLESGGIIGKLSGRHEQLERELAQLQESAGNAGMRFELAGQKLADAKRQLAACSSHVEIAKQGFQQFSTSQSNAQQEYDRARTDWEQARDELYQFCTERFTVAAVKPLSPEQIGWSVIQAAGQASIERAAAKNELDKKKPLKPDQRSDPEVRAARQKQIEGTVDTKLRANVDKIVSLFAAAAGSPQDDFFATVDQALFFANSGEIGRWLAARDGNLADKLSKTSTSEDLLEELYLSILTRRPTADEVAELRQHFESNNKNRSQTIQEAIWALITSVEFRFNH